jgi:hypothetical protein
MKLVLEGGFTSLVINIIKNRKPFRNRGGEIWDILKILEMDCQGKRKVI